MQTTVEKQRDFANTVVARANGGYYRQLDGANGACVQVKPRFMGLFDTVLSYVVGSFNIGIPEAVEYASQAVAVNEHRHGFPLESIEPSTQTESYRPTALNGDSWARIRTLAGGITVLAVPAWGVTAAICPMWH